MFGLALMWVLLEHDNFLKFISVIISKVFIAIANTILIMCQISYDLMIIIADY